MTESVKVTAKSAQVFFDSTGLICINSLCTSERIAITAYPGNSTIVSREKFHCLDCNLIWRVDLMPSKIESIQMGVETFSENNFIEGLIDREAFLQSNNPEGRIRKALEVFLKSMIGYSMKARGEAIAELAAIARVDLTQLRGSSSEEPQSLPSEDS